MDGESMYFITKIIKLKIVRRNLSQEKFSPQIFIFIESSSFLSPKKIKKKKKIHLLFRQFSRHY